MLYRIQHLRAPLAVVALVLLTVSLWLMLGGCGGTAEAFASTGTAGAGWVDPVTDDSPGGQNDWTAAAQHDGPWSARRDTGTSMGAIHLIEDAGQTDLRLSRVEGDSSRRLGAQEWPAITTLWSGADAGRFVLTRNSRLKRADSKL